MKKTFYIALTIALSSIVSKAQSLNYTDLGVLFSSEENLGTARFSGLNGAMGAVGGDLSAINVNPAGAAIFNHGEFALTFGVNNYKNTSDYYNTTTTNTSSDFNLEQIGGVFILKNYAYNSGWNKIGLSVNYQKTNHFQKRDLYRGNSGYADFYIHPNDEENEYNNAQSQRFYNDYEGDLSKLSFVLAGQFENNLNLGFALNFHSLDFYQSTELNEINEDDSAPSNVLDVLFEENNSQQSDGISVGAGVIYKPIHELRLGLAVESPTWYYTITEDYNSLTRFASIPTKNINAANLSPESSYFEYKLRTPSKVTASIAYVFGKLGFVNIDYTYKSYTALDLYGETDFREDNSYFMDVLQNTNNVNIGSEFRLGKMYLRGGFGYQQSPFKDNVDPRNIDVVKIGEKYSGSFGTGIRFGNSKLDIAYNKTKQTNEYDFNDRESTVNPAKIKNNNSRLALTYTYIF
ncbi:OmpP1/FadL family transporter [Wenyingzhuangia sp. 2_MG-2023]|uniref:OmpP1/FadL family transporter n=1 Tax=Wenyingzhuangia sp. 2_MG-2023 TaxID=3062639 RepID=UPI0026E33BCC|nr:hypothetical protein [Wenyingzhuangia sp. 2_MG-2023]MDO6737557.1 hypothetical protein [Wenyingzhuangia sp. 2_MG-2023]